VTYATVCANNRAAARAQQVRANSKQRRLSGAVSAEQQHALPLANRKGNLRQRLSPLEITGYVNCLKHGYCTPVRSLIEDRGDRSTIGQTRKGKNPGHWKRCLNPLSRSADIIMSEIRHSDLKQLKGVIFDPDKKSRMRLKTATTPIAYFETMIPCGNQRETLDWIDREDRVDIVFLSERIDSEVIENFIAQVKNSAKGVDSIFVVVKSSADGGIPVSEALSLGADGILCEPFSVANLVEVVELANKIARERAGMRARITITLLVTDLVNQIDAAAYLVKQGYRPKTLIKSLHKLGERIREIKDEHLDVYFEVVTKLVSATKPMNRDLATKIYRGASQRVRRNTEIKLWHEIANIRPKE